MHVFVTRNIPEVGRKRLEEHDGIESIVVYEEPAPIPRGLLLEKISNVNGLVCLLTDRINQELLEQAKDLRVISNFAVGYDNIDLEAATQNGILVTNTPGVLTRATAELAIAILFAVTRRVVEGDQYIRDGNFNGWSPTLLRGAELEGKTLGILGAGRIGREVGRLGRGIGMNVDYFSRSRKEDFEQETEATFRPLDELIQTSDVLSLHVPLTRDTQHLLGKEELLSMKQGAYLINTARGPVVDEEALVEVLKDGHLAGAGLDVFEEEPDVHPGLLELDSVVLLPHIGSSTHKTRDQMSIKVAKNMIAGLTGETPPDLLNPEALDP